MLGKRYGVLTSFADHPGGSDTTQYHLCSIIYSDWNDDLILLSPFSILLLFNFQRVYREVRLMLHRLEIPPKLEEWGIHCSCIYSGVLDQDSQRGVNLSTDQAAYQTSRATEQQFFEIHVLIDSFIISFFLVYIYIHNLYIYIRIYIYTHK